MVGEVNIIQNLGNINRDLLNGGLELEIAPPPPFELFTATHAILTRPVVVTIASKQHVGIIWLR